MKKYFYLLIAICMSCSKSDNRPASAPNASGTAGSLARFALVDNYLYTVTATNIKVFDVTTDADPLYKSDIPIGTDIETIFPLGNTLFMGAQSGMYIYDISNPLIPSRQSIYSHITACDPVVANEKFAFVTLSNLTARCQRGLNRLEIINISNKKNPVLALAYPMASPQGLALSGNDLFVCDDKVKWFDVTNAPTLTPKAVINVSASDAIISGKILMLIGKTGLSQYDFSGTEPKLLSKISIGQ